MYRIIDAAKQNVQEYTLSGTIDGVAFSGDRNIVLGSCSYQNQCSDTSNFNLGYVYTGVFSATFINLDINRNDWSGLEIVPVVEIDGISVPIGHFFISEANHTAGIVAVKAKDAMEKFKKKAAVSTGMSDTPYNWSMLACQECGVTFGMTEAQVRELPNGSLPFSLKEIGDIEDWIDVLYWISQMLGGFATINRNGQLVYGSYHDTVDDTIPADVRFNSGYGDEIITYTGLYVVNMADKISEYYHADIDNGYNVKLGSNPFMQTAKAQRKIYCDNLITALQKISYNSCDISIPFGCHYDLGDVLSFPGGDGDSDNKFCIMYMSWTFGGECKIKGIPKPIKTMSKTDKNIQGLLSNAKANETSDYEQKNTKIISVGDSERKLLIHSKIASNKDTKAMIHIEVNLCSTANTSAVEYEVEDNVIYLKDVWDGIKNTATKATITYIVNSEENVLHPKESWIDGNHVMHLMYILPLEQGIVSDFSAYITAEDGTIYIERGGVWMYAMGVGLVGDGHWDGTINIEEAASDWNLIDVEFESASDSVNVHTQAPVVIRLSDNTAEWNLVELTFDDADDTLNINMFTETFERITEDGTTRITEDGLTRYTEGD